MSKQQGTAVCPNPDCKSIVFILVEGQKRLCTACLGGYEGVTGVDGCPRCHGAGYTKSHTTSLGVDIMSTCQCVGGSRYGPTPD
jgi:hypothetical protein